MTRLKELFIMHEDDYKKKFYPTLRFEMEIQTSLDSNVWINEFLEWIKERKERCKGVFDIRE